MTDSIMYHDGNRRRYCSVPGRIQHVDLGAIHRRVVRIAVASCLRDRLRRQSLHVRRGKRAASRRFSEDCTINTSGFEYLAHTGETQHVRCG